MGTVEGPVGTALVGSVFGQNSFYPETLGKRRGDHYMAKTSTGTLVAYTEVKVQVRVLVRVVSIVAPFAPWRGRYPEKIRYIEPRR